MFLLFQIPHPFVFETVALSTPLLVLFHIQHFIGKTPLATRETQCLRIHHVRTMSGSWGKRQETPNESRQSRITRHSRRQKHTVHSGTAQNNTKAQKTRKKKEDSTKLIGYWFVSVSLLLLLPNILRIAHKFVRTCVREPTIDRSTDLHRWVCVPEMWRRLWIGRWKGKGRSPYVPYMYHGKPTLPSFFGGFIFLPHF